MDLSSFKRLSINGILLKELRANGELIWSALVKWAKYSCEITEAHYEETEADGSDFGQYVGSTITLYDSYSFTASDGYSGDGQEYSFNYTDDLSPAIGKYFLYKNNVLKITSLVPIGVMFNWEGDIVARCEWVEDGYSKGSTSYGTVEAETGALPEDGTLIEGSVADGYCVLKIDGTYFYYVLKND